MGWLLKVVMGILLGTSAGVIVGTGGVLDVLGWGILLEIVEVVVKSQIPGMSELGYGENFALDVFVAELRKIEHQQQADEDQERRERDERNIFARHLPFEVPKVYGQFDVSDLGLMWWSADTVIASDLPTELLGLAGEAAFVL